MKRMSLRNKISCAIILLAILFPFKKTESPFMPIFKPSKQETGSLEEYFMEKKPVFRKSIVQEYMETDKFFSSFEGSDEAVALKYLKLANAVTSRHIDSLDYCFDVRVSLEKRVGACHEFSEFTYSNFLYFIQKANKGGLSKYVRISEGISSINNSRKRLHGYLEFLKEGVWVPYEATNIRHKDVTEINPIKIDSLICDSLVLAPKGWVYTLHSCYQFAGGEVFRE